MGRGASSTRVLGPGAVLEHRVMVTTDAAIEGVTAAVVVADVVARTRVIDPAPGVTLPVDLDLGWRGA